MVKINPVYQNYWERKKIMSGHVPKFPVVLWRSQIDLAPSEKIIYESVKNSKTLLDVGAGDLRMKDKLISAGLSLQYKTQDIGTEFDYDYKSLNEIETKFEAVLFLDVIEHLELKEGLQTLTTLTELVSEGGILVVQTTNSRCLRSAISKDMTHLHSYNLPDLYAYLVALNFKVEGYRVAFAPATGSTFMTKIKHWIGAWLCVRLLGVDYADNILLVAKKVTN